MRIYNDAIEYSVSISSSSKGESIGLGFSIYTPPTNGLIVQGNIGFGTYAPLYPLHVQGDSLLTALRLSGALYDNSSSTGISGQILSSTGSGVAWTSVTASGILTGSGTANYLPKWNSTYSLTNSIVQDSGTIITISGGLNVTGLTTSTGFFGPGTYLTNLNASNLASGTVPSAVVSGTYSGITSVGTLTQLRVSGISTVNQIEIDGRLIDAANSGGSSGQLLSSTGTGVAWSSASSLGVVTGTGGANQITYWSNANQITGISTFVYFNGNVGIGTATPSTLLTVQGNASITGIVTSAGYFGPGTNITNLNASNLASGTVPSSVVSGAYSGITSVGTLTVLRLSGAFFDNSGSSGTSGLILSSTGTGVAWTSVSASGIITGSGTANYIPKWTGTYSLNNSIIQDSGTIITISGGLNVTGLNTSTGFFGPGTNITNLNASNLASGTVPSAVVSGTYSGITSVGTLTQLRVTGITTSGGFWGPGTYITNLNASNLASGTVPSAVVSGTYSGITSVGTLTQLRISGALFDNAGSSGTSGQILSSTGTGLAWTSVSATGIITGSGTTNYLPKWGSSSSLTNSIAQDNGTIITISGGLNITGLTTSTGFFGPGTFITNLNASNLSSGTVPSSVVSGTYSGITSVGTLTQLRVSGISTVNTLEIDGRLIDVAGSGGSSGQLLTSTGTGVAWSSTTSLGVVTGTGITNYISYWINANQIGAANTVVIVNNQVGIGTTSPQDALHVVGTERVDGPMKLVPGGDTSNQRIFVGANTSTTSTTFVGIASILVPSGYHLTVQGKANGYYTASFNEAGTFMAVFLNTGALTQIGQSDVNSKFVGASGNFDVQLGSGSYVNIVVKSNNAANTWAWRVAYDYLLTENSSSKILPAPPDVP